MPKGHSSLGFLLLLFAVIVANRGGLVQAATGTGIIPQSFFDFMAAHEHAIPVPLAPDAPSPTNHSSLPQSSTQIQPQIQTNQSTAVPTTADLLRQQHLIKERQQQLQQLQEQLEKQKLFLQLEQQKLQQQQQQQQQLEQQQKAREQQEQQKLQQQQQQQLQQQQQQQQQHQQQQQRQQQLLQHQQMEQQLRAREQQEQQKRLQEQQHVSQQQRLAELQRQVSLQRLAELRRLVEQRKFEQLRLAEMQRLADQQKLVEQQKLAEKQKSSALAELKSKAQPPQLPSLNSTQLLSFEQIQESLRHQQLQQQRILEMQRRLQDLQAAGERKAAALGTSLAARVPEYHHHVHNLPIMGGSGRPDQPTPLFANPPHHPPSFNAAPTTTPTPPAIVTDAHGVIDFVPREHKQALNQLPPQPYQQLAPAGLAHAAGGLAPFDAAHQHHPTHLGQAGLPGFAGGEVLGAAPPAPPGLPVMPPHLGYDYPGFSAQKPASPFSNLVLPRDVQVNAMTMGRQMCLTQYYEAHGCVDPVTTMPLATQSQSQGLAMGCSNPQSYSVCSLAGTRIPGVFGPNPSANAMGMMLRMTQGTRALETCLTTSTLTSIFTNMIGGFQARATPAPTSQSVGEPTLRSPAASLPGQGQGPAGQGQGPAGQGQGLAGQGQGRDAAVVQQCTMVLPLLMTHSGGEGGMGALMGGPEGARVVRELRHQLLPYVCQEVNNVVYFRMCCPGHVPPPNMMEMMSHC